MTVHHAVGIIRQRNSGYRPSRVNIMAKDLSTPDPSLSPTHLSISRGRATTHYTHHQASLIMSRITTPVPSLGLRIRPACEAGLSAGMRRERVSPNIIRNKEEEGINGIHGEEMKRSTLGSRGQWVCEAKHSADKREMWHHFYQGKKIGITAPKTVKFSKFAHYFAPNWQIVCTISTEIFSICIRVYR